jgi:putative sigma-54 modulation protein
MRIDFTGRQMEITSDLRQYTETHLRKITRLLHDRFEAQVILAAEKHRRTAEIALKFRDHTLVGIMETGEARSAVHGALDKLERQVVRLLEKRRTRKRRARPTSAIRLNVLLGAERADHEERRVLATDKIPIKPMTVEEAIDALDVTPTGAVVFRNAATERVNVIYQRPDGNLGLIEPES